MLAVGLKFLTFVVIIEAVFLEVNSSPFLYNSGKAIISSIFSPTTKNEENVEDLRLKKAEKQEMRRLSRDEFELLQKSENEEIGNNEASPGVIHKKIGKILAKLQLYSALRSSFNNRNKNESSFEVSDLESNEVPLKTENFTGNAEGDRGFKENAMLNNDGNSTSTESDQDMVSSTENEHKLSLGPNSIGVFFTELIASVATLIYGAALQISSNISTTTAAPN